jgi:glycine cleavage system aminomethyltransferase T
MEEERSAGTVTSVANSPRFGHIALAILRRPHHIPGNVLRVGGRENAIRASVTGLPFENRGAQV